MANPGFMVPSDNDARIVNAMCAPRADVGESTTRFRGAHRWLRLTVAVAAIVWAPAVSAQCKLSFATDMTFTGYSPFGGGVAATSTIGYVCNNVAQAWIGISTPRELRAGSDSLTYELYTDAGHAAVWPETPPVPVASNGSNVVTVYGFLPPQDAAAGNYRRNLTVSIYSGTIGDKPDTIRLDVATSSFVDSCIIDPGALAFGPYDPLGANAVAPRDAQGTIRIACTRDTSYAVGLGAGLSGAGATRQMANGGERLTYELYTTAARTVVWNTTSTVTGTAPSTSPITLGVYGRIPAGQAVAAGPYSDSVQSTINF
jgi:spore coat protein U domain-containing protein, fimbrial subunit CupE1/2/3/6